MLKTKAALAVSFSLGLPALAGSPVFASASAPALSSGRPAPAYDSLLSDSLNQWSPPAPAQGSPATEERGSVPASDSLKPKAAATRTDSAAVPGRDTISASASQERLFNTLTGSHQKAEPSRWRNRAPYPGAPLLLTLPIADLPYTLKGGFDSPSMRQSLMLSAGFRQWADQTLAWLWSGAESPFLRNLGTYASLGLFTWFSEFMPLGDAWMHEEWHRAVFTRRGIKSYNGIYELDFGSESIPVDHVEDRDLAALKSLHPADFTRLMEAGGEGEIEAMRLMRRRNFFLGRPSATDRIDWWVTGLNSSFYIWTSSVDDLDQSLRDADAKETDPRQRDFTGLDYRAWVYDLRHPDVPYASGPRGRPHPSGTGFDRYLLNSDLTAGEIDFLKLQAGLSLLNLISGQNLGWDWLPGTNPWGGQGFLWNFGFTHHLTPFGYAVGGEFLARQGKADWVFTAQGMANASLVLPCLGAELFRYPLALGREPIYLSLSLSAWLQPEDQRFHATSATPGAYGSLGAAFPVSESVEIFAEGDVKTEGWVPGVVYLEAAAEGRAGVQLRL